MTALSATPAASSDARPGRARKLLLWTAFAVGFSPVLFDLITHQIATPWARYSAVFVGLLVWSALRDPKPGVPRGDGALWVAAGAGLTLLAVGGGMPRLGRPGAALAAIGMGRLLGTPPLAALALGAWAVPIPHNVLHGTSPQLESALLQVGALLVSPFSAGLTLDGANARVGASALDLVESDGGLPLVALLSGLGYYAGLRAKRGLGVRLRLAATWGILALPIQITSLGIALVLLIGGPADVARAFLTHGVWMTVAAAGICLAERRTAELSKPLELPVDRGAA